MVMEIICFKLFAYIISLDLWQWCPLCETWSPVEMQVNVTSVGTPSSYKPTHLRESPSPDLTLPARRHGHIPLSKDISQTMTAMAGPKVNHAPVADQIPKRRS